MENPRIVDKPPPEITKELKHHRTLMIFVDILDKEYWEKKDKKVRPYSTPEFSEKISERWEGMLHNAHELGITRFLPDDDQVLLKLDDGSRAFAIKDFLIEQEECIHISIENTDYWGAGDKYVNYRKADAEKKKKEAREKA